MSGGPRPQTDGGELNSLVTQRKDHRAEGCALSSAQNGGFVPQTDGRELNSLVK